MKKSSKLACLFSLWLLSGLFTIVSLNVTDWADAWIKINLSEFQNLQTTHRARLKTLYLWNGSDADDAAWMAATDKTLDIFKWLIVDKSLLDQNANWDLILVGWWIGNNITDSDGVHKSGIAWWERNNISADNAAIGWGGENNVSWENGAVAWWYKNESKAGWVVLWWQGNKAEGIVLWWQENEAGQNGLAMWTSAKWWEWSFVRNDGSYRWETLVENKALIWAQKWLLIGTYEPKDWVSLVVNWPIQIWYTDQTPGVAWEIRSKEGCLYAFDGTNRHLLGSSSSSCTHYTVAKKCQFGRILLQEWDKVTAYSSVSAPNCDAVKREDVYCQGWELVAWWTSKDYKFPACINLSDYPYYLSQN